MLQMNYRGITILYLCGWAGSLAAQTGSHNVRPEPAVVATSGNYQLTEQIIGQALRFGQILAGTEFSLSDAATLRAGLIAYFQKEPAKQMEAYESVAKALPETPGRKRTWLDLALIRYKMWQWYAENPQAFRDFQSYPFGRMVLKYNPVLVNSGGMIVIKTDVDCQFYSDALVAKTAGVPPP